MLAVELKLPKVLCIEATHKTCLITEGAKLVFEKLKEFFDLEPYEIVLGKFKLRAYELLCDSTAGRPEESDVTRTLASLGFESTQEGIEALKKSIGDVEAKMTLKKPLEVFLQIRDKLVDFSSKKILGIDLEEQFSLIKGPAPIDPLSKIKHITMNIRAYHELYQDTFNSGTHKIASLEQLTEIAQATIAKLGEFYKALRDKKEISCVKLNPKFVAIFTSRHEINALYVIFKKHKWSGSFKNVYFGIRLKDSLMPVGLSSTDEEIEFNKEVALRRHPELSHLLTTMHLEWSEGQYFNMIHSWASRGTLDDALCYDLPIQQKDIFALQLLSKMHIFHQYAVHKDLKTTNLLIDRVGESLNLIINDVGSSCFRDDEKSLKEVTTNAVFLAPELIRRCAGVSGYFWDDLFELDISFDDWIMSERYQVGLIIAEIYLGESIHKMIHDARAVKAKFPLRNLPFEAMTKDTKLLYRLDTYLQAEHKDKLQEIFAEALAKKQAQIQSKASAGGGLETEDNQSCYNLADFLMMALLKAESKPKSLVPDAAEGLEEPKDDNSFKQQLFETTTLRDDLHEFLDESAFSKLYDVYSELYGIMQRKLSIALYEDMAKMIAHLSSRVDSYLGPIPRKERKRLEAIFPLLDLDPSKRPDLNKVRLNLLEKIHF